MGRKRNQHDTVSLFLSQEGKNAAQHLRTAQTNQEIQQTTIEHASRRIDYLFYLLAYYYRKNKKLKVLKAEDQNHQSGGFFQACHSSLVPCLDDPELKKTYFYIVLNSTIELPLEVNQIDSSIEKDLRPKFELLLNQVSFGEVSPVSAINNFLGYMHERIVVIRSRFQRNNQMDKLFFLDLIEKGSFSGAEGIQDKRITTLYLYRLLNINNDAQIEEAYARIQLEISQHLVGPPSTPSAGDSLMKDRSQFIDLIRPLLTREQKGFDTLTGLTTEQFNRIKDEYKVEKIKSYSQEHYLIATLIYKRFNINSARTIKSFFTPSTTATGESFTKWNDKAFVKLLGQTSAENKRLLENATQYYCNQTFDNLKSLVDFCIAHPGMAEFPPHQRSAYSHNIVTKPEPDQTPLGKEASAVASRSTTLDSETKHSPRTKLNFFSSGETTSPSDTKHWLNPSLASQFCGITHALLGHPTMSIDEKTHFLSLLLNQTTQLVSQSESTLPVQSLQSETIPTSKIFSSSESVGNNPGENNWHKEFTLCLLSELVNNDPKNVEAGKIYLSEEGYYYVRDHKGVVQKGFFDINNCNEDFHSLDQVRPSEKKATDVDEVHGRHGLFSYQKKNSNEMKAKFEQVIPTEFSLGESKGRGDCFYDSCAQELIESSGRNEYTVKSLRMLCHEYAIELDSHCNRDPNHPANWIAKAFNGNTGQYQQYLANVQYTVEEREAGEGLGDDKLAIWGEPHIDGRILCQKLCLKLHVIEARENPDEETNRHKKFIFCHNLVDGQGLKSYGEDYNNWNDKDTLHIAVCNLHFVPVLRNNSIKIISPVSPVLQENNTNSGKGKEELDDNDSKTLKMKFVRNLAVKLNSDTFKNYILSLIFKNEHVQEELLSNSNKKVLQKNTIIYTGVKRQGQKRKVQHFRLKMISGDENSEFTVLKTTRNHVADVLQTLASDSHARSALHEEIFAAFEKNWIRRTPEYNALVEEKNVTDPNSGTTKQKLIEYCQSQAVYHYYVQAYRGTLRLGYRSALLYAHHTGLPLTVWACSENSTQLLWKGASSGFARDIPRIHIVLMKNVDNFHHLKVVKEALSVFNELEQNPAKIFECYRTLFEKDVPNYYTLGTSTSPRDNLFDALTQAINSLAPESNTTIYGLRNFCYQCLLELEQGVNLGISQNWILQRLNNNPLMYNAFKEQLALPLESRLTDTAPIIISPVDERDIILQLLANKWNSSIHLLEWEKSKFDLSKATKPYTHRQRSIIPKPISSTTSQLYPFGNVNELHIGYCEGLFVPLIRTESAAVIAKLSVTATQRP